MIEQHPSWVVFVLFVHCKTGSTKDNQIKMPRPTTRTRTGAFRTFGASGSSGTRGFPGTSVMSGTSGTSGCPGAAGVSGVWLCMGLIPVIGDGLTTASSVHHRVHREGHEFLVVLGRRLTTETGCCSLGAVLHVANSTVTERGESVVENDLELAQMYRIHPCMSRTQA